MTHAELRPEGRTARTASSADRVYIFDTTLRDGEQSPGISLNVQEKLEIAHQLARLGVDIIEAGFPITSPGDSKAVTAIAKAVEGPVICGLARTVGAGHRRGLERGQALRAAADPHLHRDLRHPHRAQAADDARGRHRPGARGGRAREGVLRRRRVLARGRQPLRRRVHGRGREGRDRGGRDHDQHPRHGRLHDAARVRARSSPSSTGWCPELNDVVVSVHCHDDLGLAVANSFAGLTRRRAPGRVRGQRHRRARRQRVAGGDRDAAADAPLERRPRHRHQDAGDRAHQPPGLAPDRLPGAAEQGDRRSQRVRARGRHPPGRRAEGPHDLRDHGRDHDRPADELDRAGQALRPPRAAQRARGAGRAGRRPGAEHGLQALQGDRGPQEARDRARPGGDRLRRDPRAGRGLQPGLVRAARRVRHSRRRRRSR